MRKFDCAYACSYGRLRDNSILLRHEASKRVGTCSASKGEFMETLLMVAVVVITLAVVVQAGVLIAMYLLARRISGKVEVLIEESRKLMAPLQSIAQTLKAVSDDLQHTAQIARDQVLHVQAIINETRENVRTQVRDVRARVLNTVDEARETVMRPIRHYSAIALAFAEGVRTFFSRVRGERSKTHEEHPAA